MTDIKLNIKKWVVTFHYGGVSLYGSVRNTAVDSPQSYGFSYEPSNKRVDFGILSKHVPQYVKDGVIKKVIELKGRQNVRET
jgi:hypothetical protein